MYIYSNFTFYVFLNVQLSGMEHIHIVVQILPLPITSIFSPSQTAIMYKLNTNSVPLHPSPW